MPPFGEISPSRFAVAKTFAGICNFPVVKHILE